MKRKCLMPKFDLKTGLVPVMVLERQTYTRGGPPYGPCFIRGPITRPLMLACANKQAYLLTLKTGLAHFWSRRRKAIWRKGETSGQIIQVSEVRIDCDGDALVYFTHRVGLSVCHTGQETCFYRTVFRDACRDREFVDWARRDLKLRTIEVNESLVEFFE